MSRIINVFTIILLLIIILVQNAAASELVDDAKLLRVGLVDVKNDEQEVRHIFHEYSRAYLTEISKNTNWYYEYEVGTLEQCKEKLLHGELDLIGPVQREANGMIYSGGHAGYGIFSIYCDRNDKRIISGKASELKGMRIGIIDDSDVDFYLNFSIKDNDLELIIQKFKTIDEMLEAFHRGEIDLIVDDGTHMTNEEVRLNPIGQIAEHFATTAEHKELMNEFQSAITTNEISYPFFLNRLENEFLYPLLQMVSPYRETERAFIENAPILKIAFLPKQLPLYNVASSRGIYIDYIKMLSEESNLRFELIEAKSEQELGEMLWSGKADVAFVIYSTGKYNSTVSFTNEVSQELFVAIVPRDMNKIPDSANVALIHTFSGIQSYLSQINPKLSPKFYNSVDAALESVENNECDVAFLPAAVIQREMPMVIHPSLTTADNSNFQLPICIAISRHQPQILQRVLNTAILHCNQKQFGMIVHKNSEPVFSLNYALSAYPLPTALTLLAVAGTIILAGALFFRSRSRSQQNKILLKKNMELETALIAVENMRIDRDIYKTESELDKLTLLYNKQTTQRICTERLNNLNGDMEVALYIIDLDHFKEANDTFGHQYGDRVLVEFSVTLKHIFRANDCIGRFGGDEFVVMITGKLTEEVIFRKAAQIQEAAKNVNIDGKIVGITASIGIATTLYYYHDYETLFKQADKALYIVKEDGRNGYCLEPPNVFH